MGKEVPCFEYRNSSDRIAQFLHDLMMVVMGKMGTPSELGLLATHSRLWSSPLHWHGTPVLPSLGVHCTISCVACEMFSCL